jgi:chaperonin cofactor prefoldin
MLASADAWVAIVAGAALLLDLIVHLVGGTMLLARSRETLARQLTETLDKRTDALAEQIAAISEKTARIELDVYKNFIRRDSLDIIMTRLDRLDAKIDAAAKDNQAQVKELETKLDQALSK